MKQVVVAVVLLVLPHPALSQDPVRYKTFSGTNVELRPWLGQHVAVLTPPGDLDVDVMQRILDALDHAYEYYAETTGGEPTPVEQNMLNGRPTLAVVPNAGAVARTGRTGIETIPQYWDILYNGVRDQGQFNQLPFFELGFNFWRFKGLEYQSPDGSSAVIVGFAVFMRFRSMQAAGLEGGPWHTFPFARFRAGVESLVDVYADEKSLSWGNTLRVNRGLPPNHPDNPMKLEASDLFASFLFRLCRDYGGDSNEQQDAYLQRFFRAAAALESPLTSEEAVDNFVVCASQAAGQDLSALFRDEWRWPVSGQATRRLRELREPHGQAQE